ncbi:MAG: hypothetical protein RIE52_11890 [Balneola sp.]
MTDIQKYKGKRINDGHEVEGYVFKTPLTDHNSGTDPDKGWFFLSDGEERWCISDEFGAVNVVDPESIEKIKD